MKVLRNTDKWLLLATLILFAIGLVMVFSASNVAAFMRYSESPYKYVGKQAIFLVGGFISTIIILNMRTKTFYKLNRILVVIAIIALALIFKFGITINRANSWYSLGPFGTIQPSEFIKVIMILWLADYYERKNDSLNKYGVNLYPIFIGIAIAILIALQPDLGTALIFSVILVFMFFTSNVDKGIKKKMALLCVGVGIVGIGLMASIANSSFMINAQNRFDFFRPCSESKFYTNGNQICNGYIAINNGGWFGKGLGNSTQKYLYLPEAHTDFIFPIIVEECGLLVGLFVLFLYFFVIFRIIKIGRESNSNRNALICYAISFYLGLHIFINLGGVLGLMPLTGVPLPFLSYGGSFLLSVAIAMAVVQKIAIDNKKLRKKTS